MLIRKKPLQRSPIKRRPKKPKPGSDLGHLYALRLKACCLCRRPAADAHLGQYGLPNAAHHLILTGKGMDLKTPDDWAIPLCSQCHAALHNFRGYFATFSKERRAQWQIEMALTYCPERARPMLQELLSKYQTTEPDPWREIF